jgi:hypothetical protein
MNEPTHKIYLGVTMTNLTDRERELLTEYFWRFDTKCLVQTIMDFLPEDMLKDIGQKLVEVEHEEN